MYASLFISEMMRAFFVTCDELLKESPDTFHAARSTNRILHYASTMHIVMT